MRYQTFATIIALTLFVGALLLEAGQQPEAGDLLARTSARYADMRPAFLIRAEVLRRSTRGDQVQQVKREYRLVRHGDRLRIDIPTEAGKSGMVIVSRDGRLLLYVSASNAHADVAASSPEAKPLLEAMERIHTTLYGRFPDLSSNQYTVASLRPSNIKAQGERSQGYRIRLASVPTAITRWSGELWIDGASFLVWRATIAKQGQSGEFLEEVVEWKEIVTGASVPGQDLLWQPPAGSQSLRRLPDVLP